MPRLHYRERPDRLGEFLRAYDEYLDGKRSYEDPDRLGEFLRAYDEYLDGKRSYEDLPNFPGGARAALISYWRRLAHGWNPEDTWGRYAPDTFQAPPPDPLPPVTAAPEVVDLPPKPRRWWWPWGRTTIPTARVVQR